MPDIWIASFNKGKLKEFESLFRETDFNVRSASEFKSYNPPKETGKTFLDNALIKAEAFRPMVNDEDWVIGEDSGIEVEALNNLPGIFSARYAGPKAMDSQNNDKLLKMLNFKQTDNRKARYFCQIVALGPNGNRIDISGTCEGEITTKQDGTGGFGYDPLFKPNGFDTTMANISRKEKNKISHRAKASLELLKELSNLA